MKPFDPNNVEVELKGYLDCDAELVAIAREFKILALIEWPKVVQDEFLTSYSQGQPKIPVIDYPKYDHAEPLAKLEKIIKATDTKHPVAQYLNQTAKSYFSAHKLVENLSKPEMLQHSLDLYGRPGDKIAGTQFTSIDAANFFIETAAQFSEYFSLENEEICILADTIKDQLDGAIK